LAEKTLLLHLSHEELSAMKNAHERFGRFVYRRKTEKTAANIRVHMDAFAGEERGKAHLVSVIEGMWSLEH
jgi:hypothetical protein